MRLFTKSDLERVARRTLYLYEHSQLGEVNQERAVRDAVQDVAGEAKEWLHTLDVKERLVAAYDRGRADMQAQRSVMPEEAVSDLLP